MATTPPASNVNSPCDSLSPLDDRTKDVLEERSNCSTCGQDLPNGADEMRQAAHGTSPEPRAEHEATTPAACTTACEARSFLLARAHRPSQLHLRKTNGLTTLPTHELKQRIWDGRTAPGATITQVPRPIAKSQYRHPRSRTAFRMGNMQSYVPAGGPHGIPADSASMRSVVRKPIRVVQKSSANPFKRVDSKGPLPPEMTGTLIHVQQHVSPADFVEHLDDETKYKDADDVVFDDSRVSHVQSILPRCDEEPEPPLHSASTVTITDARTIQPLTVSNTLRESRIESHSDSQTDDRSEFDGTMTARPIGQREPLSSDPELELSPTIPAPSPLPEDSPHKYGLKDRISTPDMQEPQDLKVVKARRRSSGLDIFNEAKSLQTAASFLNGLSTSRRRAESSQRGTDTSGWTTVSNGTTRPSSRNLSRPGSTRPSPPSDTTHAEGRRRGHNFKPSGFAYARTLTLAQLRCFKSHARLVPSRNAHAPVECAVCHMDDGAQHFSCSWCALRMCRYCRKDFAERGLAALKERIKHAELGGESEGLGSSTESLGSARGCGVVV